MSTNNLNNHVEHWETHGNTTAITMRNTWATYRNTTAITMRNTWQYAESQLQYPCGILDNKRNHNCNNHAEYLAICGITTAIAMRNTWQYAESQLQ